MKEFVARRLKAIVIISVLVLVSLFAAFWLRGILEKPPPPKIIVVNTLRWNMTKPQETIGINENVESRYEDDNASAWVSSLIRINMYAVYRSSPNPDWLDFGINCSASVNSGYIRSIDINFSRTDNDSYMNPIEDWDIVFAQAENLNVWRFDSKATSTNEAHIKAKAVGQPNFAYLRILNRWVFYEKEARHSITVTLETTFFNGTDHIKTIMPILLEVYPS